VLKHFYQLSDDEMEFQLDHCLSFHQFVDLRESDRVPDSKTIWLFKNGLAASGGFAGFVCCLWGAPGVLGVTGVTQKGQLIDARIQEIPKKRTLSLLALPPEMIEVIVGHLSIPDLWHLNLNSQKMQELINEHVIPKKFRALLPEHL
jgi:hypothetical protein